MSYSCHFLTETISHSEKIISVLLSGTPYNNSHLDMSAQMSFIDTSDPSAKVSSSHTAVLCSLSSILLTAKVGALESTSGRENGGKMLRHSLRRASRR